MTHKGVNFSLDLLFFIILLFQSSLKTKLYCFLNKNISNSCNCERQFTYVIFDAILIRQALQCNLRCQGVVAADSGNQSVTFAVNFPKNAAKLHQVSTMLKTSATSHTTLKLPLVYTRDLKIQLACDKLHRKVLQKNCTKKTPTCVNGPLQTSYGNVIPLAVITYLF